MAFNISNFKAVIDGHGGVLGTNLFLVTIPPPKWVNDNLPQPGNEPVSGELAPQAGGPAKVGIDSFNRDLQLFADSVAIPGKSIETVDYKPQGFGALARTPIGMTQEPITSTFMLDTDKMVVKFFQRWMQEIVNTGSAFAGPQSGYKDRTDHELNYYDNYVTNIIIRHFGVDGSSTEYHYLNAYPTQLGSIQLSWDGNDQIAKLPVEFTYETCSIFPNDAYDAVDRSRGNTLFQEIARLGTIAGVINNIRRPSSIQDAINQVSNVKTLFNNL